MGWKGNSTAYKFDTCTLIGVHSTMHLVDPIKVHVSYTCVCVCSLLLGNPNFKGPYLLARVVKVIVK